MSDPTVILKADGAEAGVLPEIGGCIAFYRADIAGRKIDFLRPAGAAALAQRDPRLTGCFPLVPFSNRIRAGKFRFAGREIALPVNAPTGPHAIHGFGFEALWRVATRSESRLAIEHRRDGGAWPFSYIARQVFELTSAGLTVTMKVGNLGDEPMPLGLGWHPYFPRTPRARLVASVKKMWRNDAETMPIELVDPPAGQRLDKGVRLEEFAVDNCFTGWGGRALIEWPETKTRLELSADGVFKFLVVFVPQGRDFFCAEPVSNCTDAFNLADQGRTDTGMTVLKPGKTLRAAMRLAPESIL